MRGPLARFGAALAVGLLLASACSDDDDAEVAANIPAIADLQRFSELVRSAFGTEEGLSEETTPSVMAERATLVVTGTIVGITPGREPVDDLYSIATAVMTLDVGEVVVGSMPDRSDGRVHVELDLRSDVDAADLDRVAPREVEVALYLDLSPDVTFTNVPYRDPGAGRPDGQPLWRAKRGQGFVVEDGRGGIVQVAPYAEHPDTSLAEFLPPAEQWPAPAGEPPLACADPASLDGGVGQVGQLEAPPFVGTVAGALAQFVPGPAFLPEVERVAAPGDVPERSGYAHEVAALTVNYATYRDEAGRVVAWFRLEGSDDRGWRTSHFTACHEWFSSLPERPWPPEMVLPLECADGEGTELIMDSDPGVRVAPGAASIEAAMDQQSLVQVIPAVIGPIPFADMTPAAGYRVDVSSSGVRIVGYRDEQARLVAWFWIEGSDTEAGWRVVGFEGCQSWYDALPRLSTP